MSQEVAKITLSRIPNEVLRKANARDFVALEDGIQFKVRGKGYNKIVIKYDYGQDLYNMEFWDINMKDITFEKVKEIDGVFFDQLGDIILRGVEE